MMQRLPSQRMPAEMTCQLLRCRGSETHFKVKPTTKFEKILNAYQTKKAQNGFHFLFDGARLLSHWTPADEGLEDGDSIDAVIEQVGGRGSVPSHHVVSHRR